MQSIATGPKGGTIPVLSDSDLDEALTELGGGWTGSSSGISKTFDLAGFRQALGFVLQVGFEAEAANHHPDIDIRYSKVTVGLSTHSEGGVTAKDVELAKAIEELAN